MDGVDRAGPARDEHVHERGHYAVARPRATHGICIRDDRRDDDVVVRTPDREEADGEWHHLVDTDRREPSIREMGRVPERGAGGLEHRPQLGLVHDTKCTGARETG